MIASGGLELVRSNVTVHQRTGDEGPEWDYRYSSAIPLPSAQDGVFNANPRPLCPQETDPVHITQEARWAPRAGLDGCGKFGPHPPPGFDPPDRPTRSQSLYRLRNPGPSVTLRTQIIYRKKTVLLHHFPENYNYKMTKVQSKHNYIYSLWEGGSHSNLQLHVSASIGHRQVVLLPVIK